MNNTQLAIQFFLQLSVILVACRTFGWLAKFLGQPQVVAEMITGVCLGPSVFGTLAPAWQQALFPWDPTQSARDTQAYLFPASQLGLVLYMFVVGLEFRTDVLKHNWRSSMAVSLAGIVAPFTLGSLLGLVLVQTTALFSPKTTSFEAALFLGASLCITAFPMLARIIHFKGLSGSTMGTVALGAGAIDDVCAWCLLAVVLASFDGNVTNSLRNIFGGVAFVLTAMLIVRPLLQRAERWLVKDETLTDAGFMIMLALMSAGAYCTDAIGLHAVFGGFVTGAAMPRGVVARNLIARTEPLTVALWLPLFFTFSGLNTRIGLLNSPKLWVICGLVTLAAVLGKGVACTVAARKTGLALRESIGIGVLMNARGLMELIIINIGLQRGIITPELFAMLVIMAIATTLAASPLFDRIGPVDAVAE